MTDKIILRDSCDNQFDDLITFDKKISLKDINEKINEVKRNNTDYTNEEIYKALKELSSFNIEWIGQYEILEY